MGSIWSFESVSAPAILPVNPAFAQALRYLEKDPETNIPKVMDLVDKFSPEGWYDGQRRAFRNSIAKKDNWYELIMKVYQLDPGVRISLNSLRNLPWILQRSATKIPVISPVLR